MLYQVISPFIYDIYGDSFKDAVKKIVKFKHDYDITEMIIKDQTKHFKAQIKYYQKNGINKVGINMYPHIPMINNSYNPYIPIGNNPYIPVVINIPTN
jgi:hypothetical protein